LSGAVADHNLKSAGGDAPSMAHWKIVGIWLKPSVMVVFSLIPVISA
jgi:hypothetical protein